MKKILTFYLLVFGFWFLMAQCPDGNIQFLTQAEVDNFLTTYPNCTKINGNLTIDASGDISNLSPLSNINEVNSLTIRGGLNPAISQLTNLDGLAISSVRSIVIREIANLTNIDGLSSITKLSGGILILDNPALTSLDGLSNMIPQIDGNTEIQKEKGVIQGNFWIKNNPLVTSLAAFSNIIKVNSEVSISEMDGLANLNGLHNITEVNTLSIANNENLTNLTSLEKIENVTNNLTIFDNDKLINLTGLDNLKSVGNNFRIEQNGMLQDLTGIGSLAQITTTYNQNSPNFFDISNNPNLTSLNGISNTLTTIASDFNIFNNLKLKDVSSLNSLTSIGGSLKIQKNAALSSLNGFQNIASIGESLNIDDNDMLPTLDGFNNLTSIGNLLRIANNDNLLHIKGFNNLSSLSGTFINNNNLLENLEGLEKLTTIFNINLVFNPSLKSLKGLENITELKNSLNITANNALTDVSALSKLTTIGSTVSSGSLEFSQNNSLVTLDGCQNITFVASEIRIEENDALSDISYLENIAPTFKNLVILNNPELAICNLSNFCTYLSDTTNRKSINLNKGNCIDSDAVVNTCTLSLDDNSILDSFELFPNPTNQKFNIHFYNNSLKKINIKIYDVLGKKVFDNNYYQNNEITVHTTNLKKGIYMVKVSNSNTSETKRLIVN